jgi:hypothetical protein
MQSYSANQKYRTQLTCQCTDPWPVYTYCSVSSTMATGYRPDKILPPRECIRLAFEYPVTPPECTTLCIGTRRNVATNISKCYSDLAYMLY